MRNSSSCVWTWSAHLQTCQAACNNLWSSHSRRQQVQAPPFCTGDLWKSQTPYLGLKLVVTRSIKISALHMWSLCETVWISLEARLNKIQVVWHRHSLLYAPLRSKSFFGTWHLWQNIAKPLESKQVSFTTTCKEDNSENCDDKATEVLKAPGKKKPNPSFNNFHVA